MKHYQITFLPDQKAVRIHKGATLLEAAAQVGIILSTPCGGMGRCGKCRVGLVASGKEVLACQHTVESDLTIRIPESSRFFKQQILEHGIQREVSVVPSVQKVFLKSHELTVGCFCKTLSKRLGTSVLTSERFEQKEQLLLDLLDDQGITAVLYVCTDSNRTYYLLLDVEAGDTTDKLYGLAIDIGTTTVVAQLINLNTHQAITSRSCGNPQSPYGADVISRITYCQRSDGAEQLQRLIIGCLNELIGQTTDAANIDCNDVYDIVIVGNTAMNHLLRKLPVIQLGQSPYQAHMLVATSHHPFELGLNLNQAGKVHVPPNIAGFVGSDTVAAAMACGLDLTKKKTLLVDIGTNGEIVLKTESAFLAASCAAGPALEGAGIAFGSRAQSGAIERVVYTNNEIDVDVISSECACTICGSGLIDALAVMLELGIIDPTGRFYQSQQQDPLLCESLRRRLVTVEKETAFVLAGEYTDGQWQRMVYLTQGDIRQLQLAKAAIRAGIELLLKSANIRIDSIDQLLLAGAFGNYIQKESAVRIGLLPPIPLDKIHFVGNAAGSGAQMALLSRDVRLLMDGMAQEIEYQEIAHRTDFQSVFSEYLLFPET